MTMLGRMFDRIFGSDEAKAAPAVAPAAPKPAAPAATVTPAAAPAAAPAAPKAVVPQTVDIEWVLTRMAEKNPEKLNWQTSIVDLMKLLGMDSSLAERKELAKELGYTGDMGDSAAMNIWLHKQVMKRVAENGGRVPDSMLS